MVIAGNHENSFGYYDPKDTGMNSRNYKQLMVREARNNLQAEVMSIIHINCTNLGHQLNIYESLSSRI